MGGVLKNGSEGTEIMSSEGRNTSVHAHCQVSAVSHMDVGERVV